MNLDEEVGLGEARIFQQSTHRPKHRLHFFASPFAVASPASDYVRCPEMALAHLRAGTSLARSAAPNLEDAGRRADLRSPTTDVGMGCGTLGTNRKRVTSRDPLEGPSARPEPVRDERASESALATRRVAEHNTNAAPVRANGKERNVARAYGTAGSTVRGTRSSVLHLVADSSHDGLAVVADSDPGHHSLRSDVWRAGRRTCAHCSRRYRVDENAVNILFRRDLNRLAHSSDAQ